MPCFYCGKRVSLVRQMTDADFCSEEHRRRYHSLTRQALDRLLEHQQRATPEVRPAAGDVPAVPDQQALAAALRPNRQPERSGRKARPESRQGHRGASDTAAASVQPEPDPAPPARPVEPGLAGMCGEAAPGPVACAVDPVAAVVEPVKLLPSTAGMRSTPLVKRPALPQAGYALAAAPALVHLPVVVVSLPLAAFSSAVLLPRVRFVPAAALPPLETAPGELAPVSAEAAPPPRPAAMPAPVACTEF
ncbi:MAG TPA: hypothetical protein VHA11_12420, partial [Bryobacteraceae bacterium]|nr:hypothetical protein [Bryobacteraceae bacterium]